MKEKDNYIKSIHRIGRWGAVAAIVIMVGIPIIICAVYDCFPPMSMVLQSGGGLIMMFLPISISEVISYAAVLGSGTYITFITGNVTNLKFPIAVNALKMAEVEQSTEEGDAIITAAVSVSSMITMAILAIGTLLLVPLTPILSIPAVGTATKYIMPSLIGGVALGALNEQSGKYTIKGKALSVIPAIIVAVILILAGVPVSMYQGILIVAMIPVTILFSRMLYKRRVIKIYEKGRNEPENPDS